MISTSPQVTELVFALGKGSDLVGTVMFSDYPAQAKAIPQIGPLFTPSIEKTLRAQADWVLMDSSLDQTQFMTNLSPHPIRTFSFELKTARGLFKEAERFLSAVYDSTDLPLIRNLERCFQASQTESLSGASFIILVSTSPFIAAGQSSFLSNLISQYGGRNLISADWKQDYPLLSEEWLLRNPPELIFYLAMGNESDGIQSLITRWWPKKTPRFISLPMDPFGRASLGAIAAIYPTVFSKPILKCYELKP